MTFPLQPYDYVMLAVLLASTILGAWKGMAWQIASLASLVVSAGVAAHYGTVVAPHFGAEQPWNLVAAMIVLFLVTALAIWLLFRMVSGAIDRIRLKEFDRQIGALFGLAKGVIWCLVVTYLAVNVSEPVRQGVLRSNSGYYIAVLIERAAPVLPQDVRAVVGKYLEELDQKLDPKQAPKPSAIGEADLRNAPTEGDDSEPATARIPAGKGGAGG